MKNSLLMVYSPLVPVPVVPNLDHAWAAGFIDGEGCVRIAKNVSHGRVNPIYHVEMANSQNRLDTLEHCQKVIGVQSSICKFPDRKCFRRPVFLLTYLCANARDALMLLLPYLVLSRPRRCWRSSSRCACSCAGAGARRTPPRKSRSARNITGA